MDKIEANGTVNIIFGIRNKVTPTGICACSFELPSDQLSDLLNNPIKSCIFKKGEMGICYFGGDCERKKPLPKNFKF